MLTKKSTKWNLYVHGTLLNDKLYYYILYNGIKILKLQRVIYIILRFSLHLTMPPEDVDHVASDCVPQTKYE